VQLIKKRIANIDGLRGLSIIGVILYHTPWGNSSIAHSIFRYGWIGVELFFLISGFVIFMTLDRCKNFWEFILKRWLRLFPAMLIVSIIIYITADFFPERPKGRLYPKDLLPGLLFIEPAWLNKIFNLYVKLINGSFWSLFVECKFYVIAGLAYFILKDKKGYSIAISSLIYILTEIFFRVFPDISFFKIMRRICFHASFDYFSWFTAGIFFYHYWVFKEKRNLKISLFFGFLGMIYLSIIRSSYFVFFLGLGIYMLFILSFYRTKIAVFIESKFLLWMGFISYSLYLLHEEFIIAGTIKLHTINPNFPYFFYPLFPIFSVSVVAFFVAKYGEPQVRDFLRKSLSKLNNSGLK
jgi:peptidoglycan/LPS O-acetylase OafA/YrhL